MAWRNVTQDDILLKMAGPELDAFRSAALESSPSQADPIAGIINQVVTLCRAQVARNISNTPMEAGVTLPEGLIAPAVDLMVLAIMSRAAGTIIDPDGHRKEAARRANEIFDKVARAELVVEAANPANLDPTVLAYAKPSFNNCGVHFGYGRRAEREF